MTTERGVRELALAIVASETGADDDETQQLQAAERVLAAVQDELVRLVGATGFHALLDRAFNHAAATQGISVRSRPPRSARDSIGSFRDNMNAVPAHDIHAALVGVLVELLSLLTRLIGADITAGLVQRTWPGVAPWLTPAHLEGVDA